MQFHELSAKVRRDRVRTAVDGVLRQADVPMGTGDLVKAVTRFLDAKEQQDWIARCVVDLSKEHPQARQTGDTFVKYGKTMRRWEWLPDHKRNTRPSAEELERRREKIAELEGEDEWTVHPEPAETEEFLDDQDH